MGKVKLILNDLLVCQGHGGAYGDNRPRIAGWQRGWMCKGCRLVMLTHLKFNSEFTPENGRLEDYFPFGKVTFQGLC